ncbi:hypothetical protein SRABI26_04265 [Arthrobacter sp. Bi26]|nr:hypothetical protein SRABI26_04265 [Arthrobacter sp. Bi26]
MAGKTEDWTANRYTKMMPIQKAGSATARPQIPPTMRSVMPPRTAAVTPRPMPRTALSTVAPAASDAVTGSLLARSAETDRPSMRDVPRLPWTASANQRENWARSGSFQPSRRLTSSMASWEAPAPSDTAPGLPGIACTSMNASTATTSTVASAISRRLVMNSAMVTSIGQDLPDGCPPCKGGVAMRQGSVVS